MDSLRDLHTLCSLPALRSLTLVFYGDFSRQEVEVEVEGGEGDPEELEDARVALALARRALPALERLDWIDSHNAWGGVLWKDWFGPQAPSAQQQAAGLG